MKPFFLLFISFTISVSLYSQSFQGNVFVGLNSSQVDGDDYSGYEKNGVLLGAGVSYPFNKTLNISSEIAYSRKGSRSERTFFWLKLNYLDLPVFMSYKLKNQYEFSGGVLLGILLNSQFKDQYGTYPIEGFTFFDFMGLGGFQYYFTEEFSIGFRYLYSIMNIYKSGVMGPGRIVSAYNNVVSFNVKYNFDILQKKKTSNTVLPF